MASACARVCFFSLLLLSHAARKPDFFDQTIPQTLKSDDSLDGDTPRAHVADMGVANASEASEQEADSPGDVGLGAGLLEVLAWAPDRVSTRIALDVEYHGVTEEMLTFPMRRPYIFNAGLATLKTWLADLLAQFLESKQQGVAFAVNWRRNLCFAVFGLVYIGMVQWFLLVTVMSSMAPHAIPFSNMPLEDKLHDFAGQVDLVKQVFIDNLIFGTFIYFPVFYTIRELVTIGPERNTLRNALGKYGKNMVSDNLASMTYWIPGDFIVFCAPMWLRLPVDHVGSFLWTVMLSLHRGTTEACDNDRFELRSSLRSQSSGNPQAPP